MLEVAGRCFTNEVVGSEPSGAAAVSSALRSSAPTPQLTVQLCTGVRCRALRVVNPSPYMIYLQARGSILVASSPEILCRLGDDGVVTNRCLARVWRTAPSVPAVISPYETLSRCHALAQTLPFVRVFLYYVV